MAKLVADHWRGLDFYKPSKDEYGHALIIGCGSIGSYVAYGLARIGVKKLTLIDFDTVEAHNLPNQFFAESLNITEGVYKTTVLSATIKLMVPSIEITEIPLKWEEVNKNFAPISAIIVAVDDMDVRKVIFEDFIKYGYSQYLIDARVGGLYANIFTVEPYDESQRFYKATLHSNEEVVLPLPCTGQSVADVSMCVAGEIVNRYRNLTMYGHVPAWHTFHDYKMGQAWVQQINPYSSNNITGEIITSVEEIAKVGNAPDDGGINNG